MGTFEKLYTEWNLLERLYRWPPENGEEISNEEKAAVVYGACSVKFNLIVN